MTTFLIIVGVVIVVGGVAGLVALIVTRRWTKALLAGGGSPLTPIHAGTLRTFVDDKAAFVVTAEQTFDAEPGRVWAALDTNGLFSWLPLINGMRYRDGARGVGSTRVFDGLLVAGEEQVIAREEGHRLALTATKSSVPFVMKSIAEEYVVRPTDSGATTLTWTLAVHPRLGGLLPVQMFAPLARPVARWSLRGLSTRI
ncbi:SRPBCC family protein [Nocardia colli]|uniref:SRPBCC family protein n=1 Tax=Nocardia colli TaxID=2545717 RepID=A0A5N0EMN9_9NOCA|nr:SRPBCC family protein [Nocardia colli]KAA8890462.1 SRPBCC family protein [Nocardia colli]